VRWECWFRLCWSFGGGDGVAQIIHHKGGLGQCNEERLQGVVGTPPYQAQKDVEKGFKKAGGREHTFCG